MAASSLQAGDALAAAVAVAPRVSLDDIKAKVVGAEYFRAGPGGLLTLCVVTLVNGFTVVGEGACASPENFNEDVGRQFAFEAALRKVWSLEGYLLRQRLHDEAAA